MNKDIGFVISAFVFVLLSLTTNAQLPNLCGLWLVMVINVTRLIPIIFNNKQCSLRVYTNLHKMLNNEVEAFKINWDNCVSAGQTTWTGKYNAPEFDVSLKSRIAGSIGCITVNVFYQLPIILSSTSKCTD